MRLYKTPDIAAEYVLLLFLSPFLLLILGYIIATVVNGHPV